jgi:hypothetical protein
MFLLQIAPGRPQGLMEKSRLGKDTLLFLSLPLAGVVIL